jgi:DNA-binding MarR family transcriptional regulator
MRKGSGSIYLAGRRVRLFKRRDRPSRFWQAAFRRDGHPRPLVKSTGQADLASARRWALDFLAGLAGGLPAPAPSGPGPRREDLLAPYPFPRIRQRKRHVEREIALRTLSAYDHNPLIAQRSLAQALNVSLAIVNAYTARCVREGWLLKLERPRARGRGYRYVLTDAGRRQLHELLAAYLAQELSLFHALRADFGAMLAAAGPRPVVLLGGGDLAAIARLVLAEAGRAPLLELVVLPDAAARARLRRHPDAVIWQTGLAAPPLAGYSAAQPALLREFGPPARLPGKHVRSKTVV